MPREPVRRLGSTSRYLVIPAIALVLVGWLVNTPPGFFGKLDAIGYAVCHRIPERSFHTGDYRLPLCARCSGMYLGAVAGLIFQAAAGWKCARAPHWSIITVLALLAAAFAVDGANSYLYLLKTVRPGFLPQVPNLYAPNNTLRLLTGSGMGLGIAAMIFPAFNQSIWADYDEKKAGLSGWRPFGLLLAVTLAVDLLVLTESPLVLFPAAVLSALGVWLLLTLVYTIVWVMLLGQDNKLTVPRQLWLPFLAGLTMAIIQTAAIDALRFWLTGTWAGFPLSG